MNHVRTFAERTGLLIIGLLFFCGQVPVAHAAGLPESILAAAHLYRIHEVVRHAPHLSIPRIHIKAEIEPLGLTPFGALATPTGPSTVGLFNKGAAPGQKGTAVVVGHFGWKDGVQAVFDTLDEVRVGDHVYVEDAGGNTYTFIVTGMHIYDSDASAPSVFTSASGSHLNLITCSGAWDSVTKSYTKRLVVFTTLAT